MKWRLTGMFLLSFVIIIGCGKGDGKTLVRVGNSAITQGDLDLLVTVNPNLKDRLTTPVGRQKIIDNYVDQSLLYQESKRRGLHKKQIVKDKVDLYTRVIISQALLEEELDKKIKEYYDNHQDEFERLKLAHIYIPFSTEDKDNKVKRPEKKAEEIINSVKERLNKGEKFSELASQLSEDEHSNKLGGDIGYVTLNDQRLARRGWGVLAEKGFAMKSGEMSDVVKTSNGFHVLQVIEPKTTEDFDQAEKRIRFRIQSQAKEDLLSELKQKYKVVYAEENAGKKEAPAVSTSPVPPEPPAPAPDAAGDKKEAAPSTPPEEPKEKKS
ncbi:MAG: hypothetical protein A3I75_06880 [Deltaproteobacteria bacterium RIFCSPLOWO2_02_FULL_50_16]|nr:MAG: hypothetical protein A3B79_02810 [Deltaproteobacteria bacterium RIFCSPHIGHO2_02_FULL_50_15]OGQ57202.1 MAG: hypothetical protein A3I75_06880 [Deltaproteobacteria bacterium RIFCSPLOWO2_02_FULL_50_16]OGQ66292.1 MAG: hypothetical protein A3F89_01720 [Deltaproteobacteria bacterium RIFCSPLOWO2_12_FULL_50_11]